MVLERRYRSKYGLSLAAIAEMTGESLSSLKRQSAKNDEAFRRKVEALIAGRRPIPTSQKPAEDESDWNREISALVNVHFIVASARFHLSEEGGELWNRLSEALDYTRPYVED